MERAAKKAIYIDLFDRIQEPILIIDTNYHVIDVNPGAESFFNKNLEEFKNFDISSLFESVEQMEKEIRVILRRYHPRVTEKSVLIDNDLKHLKLESCCLELMNNQGEPEKVVQMIIKDQTELVEARKQLELKNKELEQISITDKLTSLYNRRFFDDALEKESERAIRSQVPVSLILFDVDKFKVYNDTNGHTPGDNLLKELAKVIQNNIRNIDLACRYGGEEFVIICPNTTPEQAFQVAERVRLAVMEYPFDHREKQPLGFVSVSIGIAGIPEHTHQKEELKVFADTALYQSKESGRNKTTIFKIKD